MEDSYNGIKDSYDLINELLESLVAKKGNVQANLKEVQKDMEQIKNGIVNKKNVGGSARNKVVSSSSCSLYDVLCFCRAANSTITPGTAVAARYVVPTAYRAPPGYSRMLIQSFSIMINVGICLLKQGIISF